IYRASRFFRAARRATWRRAAPIRRASSSRAKRGKEVCRGRASLVPSLENRGVRVDAAVTKKGPVAASLFRNPRVAFDDEDFFLVGGAFPEDAAERIGDEGVSPEFQAA